MAKTKKATKVVDTESRTVKFSFADGGSFTAELDKMPENIVTRLALHGIAQKLGDTYAGDVESPEHEVRGMYEELVAGEWSTRQPGEPRLALIIEAISRMEDQTVETVKSFWEELSDDDKKTLRNDPAVKAEVAKIAAERAAKAAETASNTERKATSVLEALRS